MNPTSPLTTSSPDGWRLDPHRQLPVIKPDTWHRRLYLRFHTAAAESAGSLMIVVVTIGMLAALVSTGCSASASNNPVDASKAREALRTALESWKHGDAPKALQVCETPMTVQDFDWQGGLTLVDYQVVDEGQPLDANLSVPVKLTLSGGPARKKSYEKKVFYLVGTSPSTTVFRDMFKP